MSFLDLAFVEISVDHWYIWSNSLVCLAKKEENYKSPLIPTGCYRGIEPDDMEFRVWRYRSCIAAGDCSITQEASLVVIIVIINLFLFLLAQ